MVLVPLIAFWLASSLAAYQNASQWLALLAGLAMFPLVLRVVKAAWPNDLLGLLAVAFAIPAFLSLAGMLRRRRP